MSYWTQKTLDKMTKKQWEDLCDGCGKCCLMKLQDEDTDEIVFTSVACTLFDAEKCRCKNYVKRADHVPDCVPLNPHEVATLRWLPQTCAYKLVFEGKPLYDWHHLVSGSRETVHETGNSVRGKVTGFEHELKDLQELENHLIEGL
jgi:uncharacterized protein